MENLRVSVNSRTSGLKPQRFLNKTRSLHRRPQSQTQGAIRQSFFVANRVLRATLEDNRGMQPKKSHIPVSGSEVAGQVSICHKNLTI
jgi:hypothetical protein